jgi:hypothetical protein
MKRTERWLILAAVLALLAGTADRANAAFIVVPNAEAAVEGNRENRFPYLVNGGIRV